MITSSDYVVKPFREVRAEFKVYFIFRFGFWESWHEGLISDLFYKENDHLPAIGLPWPRRSQGVLS